MEAPQFLKRLLGLRDPRRAASQVAKGVVLARQGDVRGALAAYRQAIQADDTYALAHLNVALALQDIYNEERANLVPEDQEVRLRELVEHLALATTLDPGLAPAHRALGFAQRALGRYSEARDAFQAYLSMVDGKDPHHERVAAAQREVAEQAFVDEAIAAAVADAEKIGDPEVQGREQREATLVTALEKAPQRADGWWALGVLRRARGDVEGAKECFMRAIEADPQCLPAHKELSGLYFHAQQPVEALPFARAAYEADPTNPALVCNVGVCHLALGNLAEAREYILIAKGLAPRDPIVLDCLKALEEAQLVGTNNR